MTRHLIHIGYPKAGSTFLQCWFEAHPQIDYSLGGIAGFHNVYALAAASACDDPENLWRVTSNEGFAMPRADSGSRYVNYNRVSSEDLAARQAKACAMLAEIFSDAHVLIITRGFRSMILSSYSQYVRTGGDVDLETLIDIDGDHPWDYDRLVAMYREAFGGRVIVLPYELLARDPAGFRAELERRLGLAPFVFEDSVINRSLSPVELRWYPRLARLIQRIPFGRRLFRPYVDLVFDNRLRLLIALLDRLRPGKPVTKDLIDDATIKGMRGDADGLASDPVYAPYARDYLFDRPE